MTIFLSNTVFAHGQTDQEFMMESLQKQVAMTQEMLQAAEAMLDSEDLNKDFPKLLAAKNQQIQNLQKEVNELRRQLPAILQDPDKPTVQEQKFQQKLDALQVKYSETLEKLNDVESTHQSLQKDYQNNIDKMAVYAEENERLLQERDELKDAVRIVDTQLREDFHVERAQLSKEIEDLKNYNQELLLTRKKVIAKIEEDKMPNKQKADTLAADLEQLQSKYDKQDVYVKKLVEQKKELMAQVKQLTQKRSPVTGAPVDNSKFEQQLKSQKNEIVRLEEALNKKEKFIMACYGKMTN